MAYEKAVFLDTSLIVAATVEVHPSHGPAAEFVDDAVARAAVLHISPQVCREFLVVLTRQPVSGRTFTVDEAHNALSVWMTGCEILEESEAILFECLKLVQRHGVQGKQVHDCTIAATMKVHGVSALATRKPERLQAIPERDLCPRNSHDYDRHGTLSPLAALDVATCWARPLVWEPRVSCRSVSSPNSRTSIHVVLDN